MNGLLPCFRIFVHVASDLLLYFARNNPSVRVSGVQERRRASDVQCHGAALPPDHPHLFLLQVVWLQTGGGWAWISTFDMTLDTTLARVLTVVLTFTTSTGTHHDVMTVITNTQKMIVRAFSPSTNSPHEQSMCSYFPSFPLQVKPSGAVPDKGKVRVHTPCLWVDTYSGHVCGFTPRSRV